MIRGTRVAIREGERAIRFLATLDPTIRRSVWDEVGESIARLTEQRAKEVEIVRGRGLKAKPLPTRLTFRSGRLSQSIGTDTTQRPRVFTVGTDVEYSPQHELGIPPYPKRAFLQPAAEHVISTQAESVFRKALARARSRA